MQKLYTLVLLVAVLGFASAEFITKQQAKKNAKLHAENLDELYKLADPPIEPGTSSAHNVSSNVNLTSGYLNVNKKSPSAFFYLFYKCRSMGSALNPETNPQKIPIIIWLQGGPGSSSMLGNFREIGPERLVFDNKTQKNITERREVSWNDNYHILFIEQPIGVGFSYYGNIDEIPTDQAGVAQHFLVALLNFYGLEDFKSYSQNPLYIFGESYAGHYIPPVAKKIVEYNQDATTKIPLTGVGIGDGWTNPSIQMSSYGLFGFSMALLDYQEKEDIESMTMDCYWNTQKAISLLKAGNIEDAQPYFDIASEIVGAIPERIQKYGGNPNVYNIRIFGNYDGTDIQNYVNSTETKAAWGIPEGINYARSSKAVHDALWSRDVLVSYSDDVAFLLDHIPVLLFNGQDDMIVNTAGALDWINEMNWPGNKDFYEAKQQNWILDDKKTHAGFAQSTGNLTFVLVYKSGHMVPMDQPEAALEMTRRFIDGKKDWSNNVPKPKTKAGPTVELWENYEIPTKEHLKARHEAKQANIDEVVVIDL